MKLLAMIQYFYNSPADRSTKTNAERPHTHVFQHCAKTLRKMMQKDLEVSYVRKIWMRGSPIFYCEENTKQRNDCQNIVS